MTITALPTPPSRSDTPASFSTRADAFVAALPTFVTQANALAVEANTAASSAASSAASATTKAGNAASSASAASASADAASASASAASASADAASASSVTALNAPGTQATSTTSLGIGTGAKSLTIQTNKLLVVGMTVKIASSASPTNWMSGTVTSYTSNTGALTVDVTHTNGSGVLASWTLSLSGVPGPAGTNGTDGTVAMVFSTTTAPGVAHNGYLISPASTLTLPADTTVGAGWYCFVRNDTASNITINTTGGDTVDGIASGAGYVAPGCLMLIVCQGTNYTATKLSGQTAEVKTSGTSWTAPLGVRSAKIKLQGGGGSGGVPSGTVEPGGGGSAGGYLEKTIKVTPGTAYTYAIGAGGAQQMSSGVSGNAGGSTTFQGGYSANGGSGGPVDGKTPTNGSGVSGSYDFFCRGGDSTIGDYLSDVYFTIGGESIFGGGGGYPYRLNAEYGAGGYGRVNAASGAGGNGVIILEY